VCIYIENDARSHEPKMRFRILLAGTIGFELLTVSYVSVKHLQLHILDISVIQQYSATLSDDVSLVIPLRSHFLSTGNHTQYRPSAFALVG
jgi:hypothetical protein